MQMMRRRITAAAVWICMVAAVCCGMPMPAAAADTVPDDGYVIQITGPSQVHTGEDISITITGSGDASGGTVVVAGLEIVSASGGFSSASSYTCMANLGGLTAEYVCRVTAPVGATCAFGLISPRVSDPQMHTDVDAACTGWSCAVRAKDTPAESAGFASDPTPVPTAARPAPATLSEALVETAAELRGKSWDDICTDYIDVPYEVIAGNVYLTQMTTWREYSDFMFDSDFIVLPYDCDGRPIERSEQHRVLQATGQHMFVMDRVTGEPVALQDIVIQGDVTGEGTLGISQLIRLVQAVTGRRPLVGLYKQAGDLNDNGKLDIGDLTCLAAWLRGRFLDLPS